MAISGRDNHLVRLAAKQDSDVIRIIGDPDVRQLQRILTKAGFPVGSIDGIMGANTRRAVKLAEEAYQLKLNPSTDLEAINKTLSEAVRSPIISDVKLRNPTLNRRILNSPSLP